MILGSEAIRAALASGAIVCDPAPAAVEGAHIDVRIGPWFWTAAGGLPDGPIALADANPGHWYTLARADGAGVRVPPRGFILAHTIEAIGGAAGAGLLPTLHTRSTLARWGLGVHPSAGWGDPGYVSRWTLEIINPRPIWVEIPVGARVGCIAFQRIEGEAADYAARYNVPAREWSPESMLPRRGNW